MEKQYQVLHLDLKYQIPKDSRQIKLNPIIYENLQKEKILISEIVQDVILYIFDDGTNNETEKERNY